MKSKPITILLGCTLICSVALNIFLFSRLSTVRGQIAVYSNKVLETESQLDNLYQQISDFNDLKNKVESLQSQLDDSEKQAATLATSLSDSQTQIESLEAALEESKATIEELEKQQQETVPEQPKRDPVVVQPVQSAKPPAGLGSMGTFGDLLNNASAPGDGSGAIGSFGNYE